MRWYRKLYVGETAKKDRYRIVGKVRWGRLQKKDAYLITLASNEANLLDIYPANTMLWPYFRKNNVLIIGIAKGYEEAVELACHIVAEVYTATAGFDIRSYIREQEHAERSRTE